MLKYQNTFFINLTKKVICFKYNKLNYQSILHKPDASGQIVHRSQNSNLRHWKFSVLRADCGRSARCAHSRLLQQGKVFQEQFGLHLRSAPLLV